MTRTLSLNTNTEALLSPATLLTTFTFFVLKLMRKLLILICLLTAISGCQSVPIQGQVVFYKDGSKYDVVCDGSKENTYFDVQILTHFYRSVEVVLPNGKTTHISLNSCLFERAEPLFSLPESSKISRKFSFSCQIGNKKFADSSLQLLDEEHGFLIARNAAGKVWGIPSNSCSLSVD